LPQFPDVPTVAETVSGFVMTAWNAYFAPSGTPRPTVDRLARALAAICRDAEVIKRMTALGLDAVSGTPVAATPMTAREQTQTVRRCSPL
jgi:tripartite-type tricarboxylate transporter receptor subunit TctC